MYWLDIIEWMVYYFGGILCYEYRYGYIYMYFFFVIGDWFILYSFINILYLLVI